MPGAFYVPEGELAGPDGVVMRGRAWRVRPGLVDLPDGLRRRL